MQSRTHAGCLATLLGLGRHCAAWRAGGDHDGALTYARLAETRSAKTWPAEVQLAETRLAETRLAETQLAETRR